MKKENTIPIISDYKFLKLLLSTFVLHSGMITFENQQLQKNLYDFYDNPEFHFLFEDICKKENIEGNNYVDLGTAFQTAYALGLLLIVQDNGNLKSVINFSRKEAKEYTSKFEPNQIITMNNLVNQLFEQKKVNKPNTLVKSKKPRSHMD